MSRLHLTSHEYANDSISVKARCHFKCSHAITVKAIQLNTHFNERRESLTVFVFCNGKFIQNISFVISRFTGFVSLDISLSHYDNYHLLIEFDELYDYPFRHFFGTIQRQQTNINRPKTEDNSLT